MTIRLQSHRSKWAPVDHPPRSENYATNANASQIAPIPPPIRKATSALPHKPSKCSTRSLCSQSAPIQLLSLP